MSVRIIMRPYRRFLRVPVQIGLALSILLSAAVVAAADGGPVVAVTGGRVQGALLSEGGAVFKGIPFAQPPVGALRWRDPLPAKSWTGVRDATAFGPPCPQNPAYGTNRYSDMSSEDCLYLNVWTPQWPSKSPQPVMVWIHGGGNFYGASSMNRFDGESLARHGVVLVSVNYRLGWFGFFAHPELTAESAHHSSGNQGILDQIAALKWVRDNIAKFGGDPANVTIFGESAGSLDVSVLMTSPLAKGLFGRVIAESGAVVGLGQPNALSTAEQIGRTMAADASLKELRALSAQQILKKPLFFASGDPMSLGVVTDGYVFPKAPAAVFAAGEEHRVGLIIGNNARERVPATNPPENLPSAIEALYGPLSQRGIALYAAAKTEPLTGSPAEQWATDKDFRCPAVAQLVWHAAAGNPAYEFQFSRVPPGRESVGATHASEIPYVFGTLSTAEAATPAAQYDSVDRSVSAAMQQYWTQFAKTGDPNDGTLPKWPRFDATSRAYIEFTDAGPAPREGLRRPYCDVFIENVKRLMSSGGK